jgi:glycerophosphoryl diester phosphodiesterase
MTLAVVSGVSTMNRKWLLYGSLGAPSGERRSQLVLGLLCLFAIMQGVTAAPVGANQSLDDCLRNVGCRDVLSVGHRGTILLAPENTLSAFEAAIRIGSDAIELDVRNTKDRVLIVMHDANLDRTTNCRGRLADKTWAEIKDCEVVSAIADVPNGAIPRLYEALRILKGRIVIDLDVKTTLIQKLLVQIKRLGMENQVMVPTRSVQRAESLIRAGIAVLARADNGDQVDEFILLDPGPVAVEVSVPLLPRVQRRVHAMGSRVFVNALGPCDLIGEFCYQQLVTWGADLIQTDRLPLLVPFLEETNN